MCFNLFSWLLWRIDTLLRAGSRAGLDIAGLDFDPEGSVGADGFFFLAIFRWVRNGGIWMMGLIISLAAVLEGGFIAWVSYDRRAVWWVGS